MKSTMEQIKEDVIKLAEKGDFQKIIDYVQKQSTILFTLGRIHGLNEVRISVWGIGYDRDDTARMVRKFTTNRIHSLKEPLEIDSRLPIEEGFSDIDFLQKMMKTSIKDLLKD